MKREVRVRQNKLGVCERERRVIKKVEEVEAISRGGRGNEGIKGEAAGEKKKKEEEWGGRVRLGKKKD